MESRFVPVRPSSSRTNRRHLVRFVPTPKGDEPTGKPIIEPTFVHEIGTN